MSSLWTKVIGFFSGGIGSILMALLPWILGAGVFVGACVYEHHKGYTEGVAIGNSTNLQAAINDQKGRISDLENQLKDTQTSLATETAKKNVINTVTVTTQKVIHDTVKDNAICRIGSVTINALNAARLHDSSATASSN